MGVLISAIIPVYNSEEYLEECIKSLINQSLKEIEMIFINDGSRDNSLSILEKYKKIDKRIKIINQSNSGPSNARNRGLQIAKGEYISFIDSDDWIDINMYKEMYSIAQSENADIVISDMIKYYSKEDYKYVKELNLPQGLYTGEIIIEKIVSKYFKNSLCNSMADKIFKSDIIREHSICLDESLYYAEDWKFNVDFLKYTNRAYYMNKAFYYYRRNYESSSCKYNEDTFSHNGITLYNNRKIYAKYFNINEFEGAEELLNIMKHCIIMEVSQKEVSIKRKINRINTIINMSEVNEAIIHVCKNKLSLKDKIFYLATKRKMSILLYIYSVIALRKFSIKVKNNFEN